MIGWIHRSMRCEGSRLRVTARPGSRIRATASPLFFYPARFPLLFHCWAAEIRCSPVKIPLIRRVANSRSKYLIYSAILGDLTGRLAAKARFSLYLALDTVRGEALAGQR